MKQINNTRNLDLYDFDSILVHTRAVSRSARDLQTRNRAKLAVAYFTMMDQLDSHWRVEAVNSLNELALDVEIDLSNAFFDFKLISAILHINGVVVKEIGSTTATSH